MVILRETRKLLPRPPAPAASVEDVSTTILGDWDATFWNWRPNQVAHFVSETTLLPVLFPLAPASSVDAGVAGPERDLAGLRVDQPPMLVVALVREGGSDLLNVERVRVKHRIRL